MTALPQNQDLRFSGGRFSGWRSTQAELQESDPFHNPEGKIDGVKKEDPLVSGKAQAHCDINVSVKVRGFTRGGWLAIKGVPLAWCRLAKVVQTV
jgi:hypothetical protein